MSIDSESVAVNAVKDVIMRLGYLTENIPTGDNIPIWDDFVYLYKNKNRNRSRSDLIGRIPLQIKGVDRSKIKTNVFPDKVRFRLDLSSVDAYSVDGGAILFVVYVNNYDSKCIYYNSLLPFDLANIKEKNKTKKASIELKKFPSNSSSQLVIFKSFIRNKQKQLGTVDKNRLSFDKWNGDLGLIESFTFTVDVFPGEHISPFESLSLTPDIYMYAIPKGLSINIPVEHIEKTEIVKVNNEHRIGAGDKDYFDQSYTIWSHGDAKIHFGKAMSVSIYRKDSGRGVKINFSIKGTLFEQIRDLEFAKALFETSILLINGVPQKLEHLSSDQEAAAKNFMEKLEGLKKIQNVLRSLKIMGDLNLESIDECEYWKFSLLEKIGADSSYINVSKSDPVQILTIGNIKILLLVDTVEGGKLAKNFFVPIKAVVGVDSGKNEHQVSQFLLLKAADLDVDNFDENTIFDDIIKYNTYEGYLELVNWFLLELIKAYDSGTRNIDEIYRLAVNLCIWMLSVNNYYIYRMNFIQLKLRKNRLDDEDADFCLQLIDNEDLCTKAGSLILLGRFEEASEIIEQLDDTKRTEFKTYPIYNLLKMGIS